MVVKKLLSLPILGCLTSMYFKHWLIILELVSPSLVPFWVLTLKKTKFGIMYFHEISSKINYIEKNQRSKTISAVVFGPNQ